jgi:hypothetical protein
MFLETPNSKQHRSSRRRASEGATFVLRQHFGVLLMRERAKALGIKR